MADINVVNLDVGKPDWFAMFRRKRNTVLLVEDDSKDADLIRIAASDEGFDLVVAETAEQALGILHENGKKFVLALVDVGLPRMSGWTFRRIASERWPDLRVWMISGSEHMLTELPKGIPVTLLLKSTDYHAVFRELKKTL